MLITTATAKAKPGVKFFMEAVCFLKAEVVISEPWIEMSSQNLVCKQISTF